VSDRFVCSQARLPPGFGLAGPVGRPLIGGPQPNNRFSSFLIYPPRGSGLGSLGSVVTTWFIILTVTLPRLTGRKGRSRQAHATLTHAAMGRATLCRCDGFSIRCAKNQAVGFMHAED